MLSLHTVYIIFPTIATITNSTQSYKFACCFMWMCKWLVILQKEHTLGVFEKWLLMKALVYNKKEITAGWRKMAQFMFYTPHQVLLE